ncbi:MAG: CapA family protein [Breznakia sp.]
MKNKIWVLLLFLLIGCTTVGEGSTKKEKELKPQKREPKISEVSFSAVGDNLIHDPIYVYNKDTDGSYNFDDVYKHTKTLTSNSDISYINLETLCAGESLGLSGYPTFNAPKEILNGLYNSGFNWLSASSNHSMDRGEAGIVEELTYAEKYPNMIISGIRKSAADEKLYVKEVHGVSIGFSSYTYGLNGFLLPEGKEYLVNLIDYEQIKTDVEKLKTMSNVQVVSMHWGDEYTLLPNEEQQKLAQYLSDLGVDVIVGTHPHVIQPTEMINGKDGNETLVIYSLGNFLSAQDESHRMLGGMARWKIEYDHEKQDFIFKDIEFWPTVTLISENYTRYETYALKDYTDELAKQHSLFLHEGKDVSREFFVHLSETVVTSDRVKLVY